MLAAPDAVFPAKRLKLMVSGPAPLLLPDAMPPPLPVAVFPAMVTLLNVAESGDEVLRYTPPPTWVPPPFAPELLLVIVVRPALASIRRLEELQMPPPSPEALFPEIVLPCMMV